MTVSSTARLDRNASHLADVKAVLGEEIAHSAASFADGETVILMPLPVHPY